MPERSRNRLGGPLSRLRTARAGSARRPTPQALNHGARSDRTAESGFRRPAGAASRPQFYYDLPAGPFYGFNGPGVKTLEPLQLLKHGTLKTYKDYPHGMITTQADVINADLLAFIKG
jgi:hypothetical protein